MKQPTFKVSDKVTFLVDNLGFPVVSTLYEPKNGTQWVVAEITYVSRLFVLTEHESDFGTKRTQAWPLEGSHEYDPKQWDRPGYLRHVDADPFPRAAGACVCDLHQIMNVGHDATCPEGKVFV